MKEHNSGKWTKSRFQSFVKSALRKASLRWPPKSEVLREARFARGIYICNGCKQHIPASIKVNGKRVKNALVDHINPVIDPHVGFDSWDEVINRMFCETDNLQVLCKECHDKKTQEEKEIAKERRKNERV